MSAASRPVAPVAREEEQSVELKGRASTEAELIPQDLAADRILDIVRRAREAAAR